MSDSKKLPSKEGLKTRWWYRLLNVLFWAILIVTFLGVTNRSGLFDAIIAVAINAAIMFGIWKVICYVAFGSTKPKYKTSQRDLNWIAVLMTLIGFCIGISLMFL